MNLKYIFILTILFSGLSLQSCKDEKPVEDPSITGLVEIELEHVWGMDLKEFKLNSQLVHPMTKDTLTFNTLKYYVSNIALKRTDGSWWKAPNSYYLVDLQTSKEKDFLLQVKDVPKGEYTALKVLYGVDSLRNVSGAQEGALSVSNTMFWSWNTGYIMLKAEGVSPNSKTGDFSFHLGGFKGDNAVPLEREFDFGRVVINVNSNTKPVVHLLANPARLWHTTGTLADTSSTHMPGSLAKTMTSDFYTWTRLEHVHL